MELVDGYDDIPEDEQAKVKRALEQEHVDDEDWNGVCIQVSSLHLHHLIMCRISR